MYPQMSPKCEWILRKDAVQLFKEYKNDWKKEHDADLYPVVIVRDPIERIWSAWQTLGKLTYNKLTDYLMNDYYNKKLGEWNPIKGSNYQKYIEPFKDLGIEIYSFEHMRYVMSPLNQTKNKITITETECFLIKALFNLEMMGSFPQKANQILRLFGT